MTAPSALVGTWIYLEITPGGDFDHTWTFDATNGYTYQAVGATGSCQNTGSYALSGNTLTYTVSTQTNDGLICVDTPGTIRTGTVVISATSFTLTEDSSGISVTYTKQ